MLKIIQSVVIEISKQFTTGYIKPIKCHKLTVIAKH